MSKREDVIKFRWPLYDAAIRAGRPLVGTDFWPELGPLTLNERRLVQRLIWLERSEGSTLSLPSEVEAQERAIRIAAEGDPTLHVTEADDGAED